MVDRTRGDAILYEPAYVRSDTVVGESIPDFQADCDTFSSAPTQEIVRQEYGES